MWPSLGLTKIFARSSGRGVGPSKLITLSFVVAAAVAWALELVLRREPGRRAAEVGADGDEGEDPAAVVDEPDEGRYPARNTRRRKLILVSCMPMAMPLVGADRSTPW